MHVLMSLGSNLGDRLGMLRAALKRLDRIDGVTLGAVSHCYETEPMGVVNQPAFLNLAAEVETDLTPLELLDAVKDIEHQLGRRTMRRWGPREIDIDLILWGAEVCTSERLTLPHAAFRERGFVLIPMAEIAPDALDPVTGETVGVLAASSDAQNKVRRGDLIVP